METRAAALARRIEAGAAQLAAYARTLSASEWTTTVAPDGRTVGVIVHHVASMYPVEVDLARELASGRAITGVTWPLVADINARHAAEFAAVDRDTAVAFLERQSRAAAEAVRAFTDEELDRVGPVSLNADAPLSAQFFLEDHAVRHSWHHLAGIRRALATVRQNASAPCARVARTTALAGIAAILSLGAAGAAAAQTHDHGDSASSALVQIVRESTRAFADVTVAEAGGYAAAFGCVSGPQEGAMGVHFINGGLVADGEITAARPEALMYEVSRGRARLLGVEYIVDAATWLAKHSGPPQLEGQAFQFVGAPNRYALPAFFELHVWAWRDNPSGTFADWNTRVSCDRP